MPNPTISRAAQFSLSHVLAWMSATCVVFAFQQWRLNSSGRDDDEPFRWYFNVHLCFFGPLDGACYGALVLMLLRRFRGLPGFPHEPGHWFLVIRGVSLILSDAIEVVMYTMREYDKENFSQSLMFSWAAAVTVAQAAPEAIAAIRVWKDAWWRTAFLLMLINSALSLLHTALVCSIRGNPWFLNAFAWGLAPRIIFSLAAVLAAIATVRDRKQGKQRDFLHWAGTAALVLYALMEWPTWVMWWRMFG